MSERGDALSWIDEELARLDRLSLRRRLAIRSGAQGALIRLDGAELINFSSNDYLGLASDPRLAAAVSRATAEEGWGAGASPLISGRARGHQRLEEQLARFLGSEAALTFSSGFAANAGTLAALAGEKDALFADRLNHASLIDGARLTRGTVHVYPHVDVDALRQLLSQAAGYRRRLIVTDSLFSMDGDLAPLADLAELGRRYDAALVIDEAHATGVFGARGRGVAEHLGVEDAIDVHIGTLSKSLGCSGGFASGSGALIEWLVNRARPYFFSTAQPAAACAAVEAALAIVQQEAHRGQELLQRAAALRKNLQELGWDVGASQSQIVPVMVGAPEEALALAARLRGAGLLVPAIRPPTVPAGRSCLRISLSYAHTPEMISRLIEALGERRAGAPATRAATLPPGP